MGICRSRASCLMSASTSWPFMRGSDRSSKIRSGLGAWLNSPCRCKRLTASSPLSTTVMRGFKWPSRKASLMRSASSWLSSTRRISTIAVSRSVGMCILLVTCNGTGKVWISVMTRSRPSSSDRLLLLQLFDKLADLFAVRGRVHPGVLVCDLAVEPDDEGPARGRHFALEFQRLAVGVLDADHAAFAERHAEFLGDAAVLIGEEREIQLLGLLEQSMGHNGVAADAHDDNALLVECIHAVSELLCLSA